MFDIAVSKQGLDRFRIGLGADQERCQTVAQVVTADAELAKIAGSRAMLLRNIARATLPRDLFLTIFSNPPT